MYVGVILLLTGRCGRTASIPHVCGGDPVLIRLVSALTAVFPMYVGVILHHADDMCMA